MSKIVAVGLALAATTNLLLAAPVSPESAQAYVRKAADTNASNVVLYSPDEAGRIIDTVFRTNRRSEEDYPDWKFERMKHLVADGLAALVGYDDVECERSDRSRTFAMRIYRLVRRFRDRERQSVWRGDREFVGYRPRLDCPYDEVDLRKATGERIYGPLEWHGAPESAAALFGPDVEVGLDDRVGTNGEMSVVADVEAVTLSSVSGLEKVIAAGGEDDDGDESAAAPVGHYRVSLLVRAALAGAAPANRLVFTARTDATNATVGGHWLFYRGVTLKADLRKTAAGHSICRLEPVLPYPPYAADDVVVCPGEVSRESRFSLIDRWFDGVERGGVTILYGDHTRADYFSRRNLIEGPCGTLPDFGANAWVCVWTHGRDSNLDYWRNAWFADVRSVQACAEDPETMVPLFRPAAEALAGRDADRLRFNWWSVVFPTVSFDSPATVKDMADFFTLATRSCAGDEAYRVVADPSAAARRVRPFAASGIGAWEALRRIASENGCEIGVDGTNVTLSAELTDGEVATPRVDELAARLERAGLGSTAGARYANVSLWASGLGYAHDGSSTACEAVAEVRTYRMNDDEGDLFGNGWVRTAADGTEQVLAYDAAWWDGAKGWRPDGGEKDAICLSSEPVRMRRDFLRALDSLNLLAEGAYGWDLDERQVGIDMHYLAFALHLSQAGFRSEGQQLADALWRRPAAAKRALARLRERIGRPEAKCRDSREWYLLMRSKAREREKAKDEGKDKEDEDEGEAD